MQHRQRANRGDEVCDPQIACIEVTLRRLRKLMHESAPSYAVTSSVAGNRGQLLLKPMMMTFRRKFLIEENVPRSITLIR